MEGSWVKDSFLRFEYWLETEFSVRLDEVIF